MRAMKMRVGKMHVGVVSTMVLAAAVICGPALASGVAPDGALPEVMSVRQANVEASLVSETVAVTPGRSLLVGLRLKHDPKWHTYWRNGGDAGIPTSIEWTLPDGFEAGPIDWPAPERETLGGIVTYGYSGDMVLPVRIRVPEAIAGRTVKLAAEVTYLSCADVCIPGMASLELELPVAGVADGGASEDGDRETAADGAGIDPRWRALFEQAARSQPQTPGAGQVAAWRAGDRVVLGLSGLALLEGADGPGGESVEATGADVGSASGKAADVRPTVGAGSLGAGSGDLAADFGGGLGEGSPASDAMGDAQRPPAGESGGLEAYFFPADMGVLDQSAAQPMQRDGNELTLTLPPAPLRDGPIDVLRGVLVVEQSGGERYAFDVDVPVADQRPAEFGAGGGGSAGGGASRAVIDLTLPWALGFAFVGGIILNIMPCVFPVLSIKIMGFVHQARQSPWVSRVHGLVFGLGVLTSFWVLAGALIVLQQSGQEIGWGFQLSQPWFVALMIVVLFLVGLNLSGVFEVGQTVMNAAGRASSNVGGGGLGGSFGSGVLATVVATPCTAPFMGPAIAYGLTLTPWEALAVFTALGGGMALPYVVLSMFPAWLKYLPKPGPWMGTFRQAMAFPMFLVVIWLVTVYAALVNLPTAMLLYVALGGLLLVAVGAWVWGKWTAYDRSNGVRLAGGAVAIVIGGLGAAVMMASPAATGLAADLTSGAASGIGAGGATDRDAKSGVLIDWQPFDEAAIARWRAEGRPVFIDFTADWCLSCKFNEAAFLNTATVRDAVERNQVVMVKADWTRQDPAITAALDRYGRRSVPLYVALPAEDTDPVVLPTVITAGMVADALDQVGGGRARAVRAD